MKRLIQFLFLVSICVSAFSQASGLADLKFGQYQVADSQWNVSACMYSSTCQIYSKNPGTAYKIPWTSGQVQWSAGDYISFVATGDTTNPWKAIEYTSNGTQKAVMGTGHIINMGANYFFFVGNDNNTGQLFSMTSGFSNTSGVTWTGTLNPTVAQVNAYATNGSTTPLAPGQTVTPAAPPPVVHYTTGTEMNVAGGGSAYAFVYQGNSSDYSTVQQIKSGAYWHCSNCDSGQIMYGRVASVVDNGNGYFYIYLTDNNGNAISPQSGKSYTYSDTSLAPTVTGTSSSTIITTTISGSTTYTYSQPVTITTWSDGSTTTANNGSATLISTTITGSGGGITTQQQNDVNAFNSNPINGSGIYIQQSGNHDVISINQIGAHNLIGGVNQQFAKVQDGNNYISIKQGNGNIGKNEIDMSVTGGSNNLYLVQASDPNGISAGDNYQKVNVSGFSNTVNASQTNDGGLQGHFAEIDVTGNYNNINVSQNNNTQKQAFISANGNNNTIQTTQSGTGAHYVSVSTTGDGNSATVNQSGSTANSATIALTNAGAPASVNLTQTGGQSYSVNQTCYSTCGTISVRQGN